MKETNGAVRPGGPFRLLKYFAVSGVAVIAVVTLLLGVPRSQCGYLLKGAENTPACSPRT
jgi:hypothetical protein